MVKNKDTTCSKTFERDCIYNIQVDRLVIDNVREHTITYNYIQLLHTTRVTNSRVELRFDRTFNWR